MTVQKIAERLLEPCRKGDFETAQKELYATDVISIEPYATDNSYPTPSSQAISSLSP